MKLNFLLIIINLFFINNVESNNLDNKVLANYTSVEYSKPKDSINTITIDLVEIKNYKLSSDKKINFKTLPDGTTIINKSSNIRGRGGDYYRFRACLNLGWSVVRRRCPRGQRLQFYISGRRLLCCSDRNSH